jgi:hypothetical protein
VAEFNLPAGTASKMMNMFAVLDHGCDVRDSAWAGLGCSEEAAIFHKLVPAERQVVCAAFFYLPPDIFFTI